MNNSTKKQIQKKSQEQKVKSKKSVQRKTKRKKYNPQKHYSHSQIEIIQRLYQGKINKMFNLCRVNFPLLVARGAGFGNYLIPRPLVAGFFIILTNKAFNINLYLTFKRVPPYCATKKQKYFGFKLVALWNNKKIVCFSLVSANSLEQKCLLELVKRNNLRNIDISGDKGFILKIMDRKYLSEFGIELEAIPRKNMKQIVDKLSLKKKERRKIETCFSVLKYYSILKI